MRHPLHSICPYFAMFPEDFVAEQVLAYTRPGDLVFDPFCGRGTTILESLLNSRRAIGLDVNPVAACVAGAKAEVPPLQNVHERIEDLEKQFESLEKKKPDSEFFARCFHEKTFAEVAFLRETLDWRSCSVDRFISAVCLGILHGESHRSGMYLSNRMPRTISTKPEYSVRWWAARNLDAPERHTFKILRAAAAYRYTQRPPDGTGVVYLRDSREAATVFPEFRKSVNLVVTSPPYLDTTDYAEDQWLRLWFLGGESKPVLRMNKDDRHTVIGNYWKFLDEVWCGVWDLLADSCTIVVRIGGTKMPKDDLFEGLHAGMSAAFKGVQVKSVHRGKSSDIARRQTNSFRPGTSADRKEHDFVFQLNSI